MSRSTRKAIPGVHIQWPWSQLIILGKKTVETRSYPLPKKYLDRELAIIETVGPNKKQAGFTKARIIGTVMFSGSFLYNTKNEWVNDYKRHLVPISDPTFQFTSKKEKWGWEVKEVHMFQEFEAPPNKRGIIFASNCLVQIKPR